MDGYRLNIHLLSILLFPAQVGRLVDPLQDAARVLAVRQAVGERVELRADANQAWTLPQASAFGRSAAPAQLQVCSLISDSGGVICMRCGVSST